MRQTSGVDSAKTKALSLFFEVLDVEAVRADSPNSGLKNFVLSGRPKVLDCDIAIVGGGLGGVAAALAALRRGSQVVMCEETSWLGGQITAQGVSALDENDMVETSGACRSYQELREKIRDYYKEKGATEGGARFEPHLDPGNCWVSRLAFEPKAALAVIDELLSPYFKTGQLRVFMRHKLVRCQVAASKVRRLLFVCLDGGDVSSDAQNSKPAKFVELRPRFCLDATELSDMLPLSGVPFSQGAEAHEETDEAHAPLTANEDNVQDFTYPFVVEFVPDSSNKIPKPALYEEFKAADKFSFNGYKMFANSNSITSDGGCMEHLPFWEYRRLIAADNFPKGVFNNDLSMINWDSNDMRAENIIVDCRSTAASRLARAKLLSLGFLYWLQNEAPRDEGGYGYPELKLRTDVLGTDDGLSKYPYIRESRRIKSLFCTIREEDIVKRCYPEGRARFFSDSVGIGHYPVDIHGFQDVSGAAQATARFQIPFFAMIPQNVENLLPSAKNIATTHITNGAYRLHPIEWAIGETAGIAASLCLKGKKSLLRIFSNRRWLRELQSELVKSGSPIYWYVDVPTSLPEFEAIQLISQWVGPPPGCEGLSFRPSDPVSREEVEAWLDLYVGDRSLLPKGSTGLNHNRAQLAQLVYGSIRQRFLR